MDISIKSITENYRDRIERLALFDTLYALERKTARDNSNQAIDYFGLGLLSLLFFFEKMLIRDKKAGIAELAEFLMELTKENLDLTPEDYLRLALEIIQVFRPAAGKRNSRSFFNWETKEKEIVQYSILKASYFDTKTNSQYYELAEKGLELIFATKEYFSEFQLSIHQLILRKQLEKGEFLGALRQIEEMQMDVRNLQEMIYRVKHEIQRNIISDETYQRYEKIVDDIYFRLNRENEEFVELKSFVKETKERLEHEVQEEKMQKAYRLIVKIDQELGEVHYEHRLLLSQSIEMKTAALSAAQESLYYIGVDSFNFKEQITDKLISTPLPIRASRRLASPFLYIEKAELWSPLAVFAKQSVAKNDYDYESPAFARPIEEGEIEADTKLQAKKFLYVMELILKSLNKEDSITLAEFIGFLQENALGELLTNRYIYDFWLLLHYNSPIEIKTSDNQNWLLERALKLLDGKYRYLEVIELKEILQPDEKYMIKNMEFSLKEKLGEISDDI